LKAIVYSLLFALALTSQAQTDSLKGLLKKMSGHYQARQPDSVRISAKRILAFSAPGHITYRLLAYNYLANTNVDERKLKEAFENYYAILKLCDHDSLSKHKVRTLNGLGALYFEQHQFDLAKKLFKEEIALRRTMGDSSKLAGSFINISSVYRKLEQYDSVMFFLNQAGSIAYKSNKPPLLAHYFNSMANHYFTMYKNKSPARFSDSAVAYYNKAIAIWLAKKDLKNALKPVSNLGYLYQQGKEYKKAIAQFYKAERIADSLHLTDEKVTIYGNIAETCVDMKDYVNATAYFKKLQSLKDSLQKEEVKQYSVMLDKQYQLENKSKTILQQDLELEHQNNQINTQQKQLYLYLLLLIVLLTVIFAVMVYFNFNKRVQKKVEEAKEKFFVNIMHEIRTPLSMIQAPLKALKPKVTDAESLHYIALAEKNTTRLNELITQMLDVSKIDSPGYRLNFATGHVTDIVKELVDTYQKQAQEKSIHFITELDIPDKLVLFDKDALEKILGNLLSNAVKYTGANGIVGLSISSEENEPAVALRIEVWDTGIGIPKEEQDKLFTRFFRSKNSKDNTKGVGIGLSLVQELVIAWKGKIGFSSEEHKGSRFSVELSMEKAVDAAAEHKPQLNEELPLVLVVEDDEDISSFLSAYLGSRNFSVIKAGNGLVAGTILENTVPDLIITDLMMEQMDGLSFIKTVKQNKGLDHIPVIVLSAKSNAQSRVEALNAGAQAFISKPFIPEELYSIISNQLELIHKLKKELNDQLTVNEKELSAEQKFVSSEPYTQKLFGLIFTHLDNPELSVEFLADLMATNRSHFQRKIKSLTGYSPSEIIKLIRLEKAREFLKAKKGNITEVAYLCGFSSQSYFTKCFTEQFNETPSAFIQANA
jgi:signal transduction histidine kinase/DNA-binding response OmpR family regulator